jgi:23S rRNA (guanosine2251-2'-O)-methyltransferase
MATWRTETMMLYGVAPVHAALELRRRELRTLYLKEGSRGPALRRIEELAAASRLRVERRTAHALGNLAKTGQHQGVVLACGELPTYELPALLAQRPALLVALDQVEDPQNLGSIARSACFFGAGALLVLRQHSAPLSAAASKASAGALERLPIVRLGNLAQALSAAKDSGYRILGAVVDAAGSELAALRPGPLDLLVLGGEGAGLRALTRRRCDLLVRIEGGGVESLNVGVAAGVLLYRLRAEAPLPPLGRST